MINIIFVVLGSLLLLNTIGSSNAQDTDDCDWECWLSNLSFHLDPYSTNRTVLGKHYDITISNMECDSISYGQVTSTIDLEDMSTYFTADDISMRCEADWEIIETYLGATTEYDGGLICTFGDCWGEGTLVFTQDSTKGMPGTTTLEDANSYFHVTYLNFTSGNVPEGLDVYVEDALVLVWKYATNQAFDLLV